MIYISERTDSDGDGDVVASFLEKLGLGEGFEITTDDIATEKKFEDSDVVIFVSRGSLNAAMIVKGDYEMTKVILISSSIDGGESNEIVCNGVIFIKKDKLLGILKK